MPVGWHFFRESQEKVIDFFLFFERLFFVNGRCELIVEIIGACVFEYLVFLFGVFYLFQGYEFLQCYLSVLAFLLEHVLIQLCQFLSVSYCFLAEACLLTKVCFAHSEIEAHLHAFGFLIRREVPALHILNEHYCCLFLVAHIRDYAGAGIKARCLCCFQTAVSCYDIVVPPGSDLYHREGLKYPL